MNYSLFFLKICILCQHFSPWAQLAINFYGDMTLRRYLYCNFKLEEIMSSQQRLLCEQINLLYLNWTLSPDFGLKFPLKLKIF